jgi:hemoglobin-like flavoprotein
MLQEVLRLFLAEDPATEQAYLHFETRTHRGYGVEPAMYRHLFSSLRDTVREALGNGWNAEYAAAWAEREERLLRAIDAASVV